MFSQCPAQFCNPECRTHKREKSISGFSGRNNILKISNIRQWGVNRNEQYLYSCGYESIIIFTMRILTMEEVKTSNIYLFVTMKEL